MIDIKIIRDNPQIVRTSLKNKDFDPSVVDKVSELDRQKRELAVKVDELRAERNKLAAMGPHTAEQGKRVKSELQNLEDSLSTLDQELQGRMLDIPNLVADGVPVGIGETANRVIKTVGDKPAIADPLDHVALGEKHDLFDTIRGAKVATTRFNFLKNQSVNLEFALVRIAMDIAQKHSFAPMIVPNMVNESTAIGTGYLPLGADEAYKTQDNLYLIATSEMALVAYHKDEILFEKQLPIRYVGFSPCYRREAGSYGKDTRGILRQHQFDKVELVSLVKPENSETELKNIIAIEEEIMSTLGLPYHIVEIGSGDLGIQAARKYDIETWLPGQNAYRETHSASNTTDYQARRLNIRYRTSEGKNEFVHTINGTAIAIGRILIAIYENYQQPDRSINLPEALWPYLSFKKIG